MKIIGTLILENLREDGTTLTLKAKNMTLDFGLDSVVELIAGKVVSLSAMNQFALGDGTTAPALTDTKLQNELRRDAAVVTKLSGAGVHKVEFSVVHAKGSVVGTFSEAGIFNAASGGDMFNHVVFSPTTFGATDTLTSKWVIEVRNA